MWKKKRRGRNLDNQNEFIITVERFKETLPPIKFWSTPVFITSLFHLARLIIRWLMSRLQTCLSARFSRTWSSLAEQKTSMWNSIQRVRVFLVQWLVALRQVNWSFKTGASNFGTWKPVLRCRLVCIYLEASATSRPRELFRIRNSTPSATAIKCHSRGKNKTNHVTKL